MLPRFLLAIAALALLAPAAAAAEVASETLPVGFTYAPEGYELQTPVSTLILDKAGYLLVVDYDMGQPGQAGDETLSVANTLSFLDATVATAENPFFDGPTPPAALDASLRSVSVPHPGFELLREVDDALLDRTGAPADLYVGEDGLDVGYDLLVRQRQAGEDALPWLTPENSDLPVHSDADAVTIAPTWAQSMDELLDESERNFLQGCGEFAAAQGALTSAHCADLARFDDAKALMPNIVLYTELTDVGVKVNPPPDLSVVVTLPAPVGSVVADVDGVGTAPLLAQGDEALPAQVEELLGDAENPAYDTPGPGPGLGTESASLGSPAAPAALMTILALAAGAGLALLAIPLYRRIVRGKVLDNDVRGRILALVQAQPGLHESAVAQQLQVSHTLAQYHVRMLAEFGLVEVRKFGGRKCLFAAGQMGRSEKTMLLAERGRSAQVVDLVAAQPGIAQRELARALGIRESSVKWHLDRLEQSGVVCIARGLDGKRVRLTPEAERTRLATFTRVAPEALPVGPAGATVAPSSGPGVAPAVPATAPPAEA